MEFIIQKRCSKCKETKDILSFYKNKAQCGGYSNLCKGCDKERKKVLSIDQKIRQKKAKQLWKKKNIEKVRSQGRKDKKNAYNRRAELINAIKISIGGCNICGYTKCLSALHFHHKDPKEKSFSIRDIKGKTVSLEKLKEEINKCILICANCHSELHEKERKENGRTNVK